MLPCSLDRHALWYTGRKATSALALTCSWRPWTPENPPFPETGLPSQRGNVFYWGPTLVFFPAFWTCLCVYTPSTFWVWNIAHILPQRTAGVFLKKFLKISTVSIFHPHRCGFILAYMCLHLYICVCACIYLFTLAHNNPMWSALKLPGCWKEDGACGLTQTFSQEWSICKSSKKWPFTCSDDVQSANLRLALYNISPPYLQNSHPIITPTSSAPFVAAWSLLVLWFSSWCVQLQQNHVMFFHFQCIFFAFQSVCTSLRATA